MPKNVSRYYWLCQIVGWTFVSCTMLFFAYTFDHEINVKFIEKLFVITISGIFSTHLFRAVISRLNWLMLPVEKVFPRLLIGIIAVSIFNSLMQIGIIDLLGIYETKRKLDFSTRLLASTMDYGLFIAPWTLIYYIYHYIQKSGKQQVDTLKLEALVKEL